MSVQRRPDRIELGPTPGSLTDYTCWFSEFVIQELWSTVQKAPTPGSPDIELKKSAKSATVAATFLAVPHGTAGLWWELNRAANTVTGELAFAVVYDDDVVSDDNPKFTGVLTVTSLSTGAPAYQPRWQSQSFPARGITRATSE